MAKPKGETKKRRGAPGMLLRLGFAVLCISLLASFISGQVQVAQKQRELREVTAKLDEQLAVNAELEQLMESGDEDAYVERIAREQLGYVRPNEKVFIDITGE